jgi:hypothetical protein
MAKRQEITVEIDPKTGAMTADVVCGPGGALCETMLEEVLDLKADKSNKKPEYYQRRQVVGQQKAGR